jgi:hypothetical protein
LTTTVGFVGRIENAEAVALDPERATLLVPAEVVNARVAVKLPAAVGLKTRLAEQLAAAARLAPQVLVEIAKTAAFVPEMATLLIVMAAVVPLLRVADCAGLVAPGAVLPNDRVVGLALTVPPVVPVPVPDSATVCGLLLAVSVKLRVAVRVPVVVGANTMVAVQLAEAARVVPQVLLDIL